MSDEDERIREEAKKMKALSDTIAEAIGKSGLDAMDIVKTLSVIIGITIRSHDDPRARAQLSYTVGGVIGDVLKGEIFKP